MDNDRLVSVIVPVYNVKPYLAEALDSVVNQSYKNLEIIIVDDGSTDGSGEICDRYAERDRRIRVVHQSNKGLSSARNTGLDIMTGELVAFLDSDDAYHPDFVRLMAEAMEREKSELVTCKTVICNTSRKIENLAEVGENLKRHPVIYYREDALRALADNKMSLAAWNKLYRSQLWERIRFPVGRVYEDNAVLFRVVDECKTVCELKQPLYWYRKTRAGSISWGTTWRSFCDWRYAKSQFDSFIRAHTPDIFSEKHLQERQRREMWGMIALYARCLANSRGEKKAHKEQMRRIIISSGKKVGIKQCKFKTRVAYFEVCHCPWLLCVSYTLKWFVKRVRECL